MRIVELGGAGPEMPGRIETLAKELGLVSRLMRGQAAEKRHWHLRRAGEKGTLEITWLLSENRTWVGVHSNREGAWIDETINRLLAAMDPNEI